MTRAYSRDRIALLALLPLLALAGAGCGDDNNGPSANRTFDQVQRLGNPLISEVLLMKSDHPLHGSIGPDRDVAQVRPLVTDFLTDVAGRDPAYADVVGGIVTPDMLIVQTDKDAGTAGWLSWALAEGWGGRKLDDDVVDLALQAVFGGALGDEAHATPALTTDNVATDSPTLSAFPYVGAPN